MRNRDFIVGRSRRAIDAWRWECFRESLPFLHANLSAGELYVELRYPWSLTRRLWWRLEHSLVGDEYLSRSGDSFWLMKISKGQTERRANQILDCIRECKPNPEEGFDIPPEFGSGLATCVWNEAFETELTDGELYEVKEIPNMAGHVVVWRPGRTPLVGIHMDRFRFLHPD